MIALVFLSLVALHVTADSHEHEGIDLLFQPIATQQTCFTSNGEKTCHVELSSYVSAPISLIGLGIVFSSVLLVDYLADGKIDGKFRRQK